MKIIFTNHAEERILKRRILKEEVINAINNPHITLNKLDKHYFQKVLERGKIEVVCQKRENNIKVITVYWI